MKRKLYSSIIAILVFTMGPIFLKAQVVPVQGDIIISEFMTNPSAVSDTKGEWFELHNISGKTLILNGLIIKDESTNRHVIEWEDELLLPADGYFIMARSADFSENGGINPDYTYSNFAMGNTEDEIIICLPDGSLIDQVAYNGDWEIKSGASLELDPDNMDKAFNQDPASWKLGVNTYGMGDLGSPGYENSSSTGLPRIIRVENLEVYPNPCYGDLYIDIALNKKGPVKISLFNLAGQEIVIYGSRHCDELNLQFDTDGLQKGVWMVRMIIGEQSFVRKLLVY